MLKKNKIRKIKKIGMTKNIRDREMRIVFIEQVERAESVIIWSACVAKKYQ